MQILTEIGGSENSKALIVVEIIEYIPDAAVGTKLKKVTHTMPGSSLNEGEELIETITPCDIYIQRTSEVAELIIGNKKFILEPDEGVFLPARKKHYLTANDEFSI